MVSRSHSPIIISYFTAINDRMRVTMVVVVVVVVLAVAGRGTAITPVTGRFGR